MVAKLRASLDALDAKASHMPRSPAVAAGQASRTTPRTSGAEPPENTYTIPEVIDMYNSLQELRRKAGLPPGKARSCVV